ncbi:hypothetical protein LINGRAHAP2_LOCUS20963 [Linum grandiflorum]
MSKLYLVLDACISAFNTEVNRRPYHRNCDCALHKKKGYSDIKESNNTTRPCLTRSVTFPCDKKMATKINQRCRAYQFRCVETKKGPKFEVVDDGY